MTTVAALYVDPRGPYPRLPGVDAWDEQRDARRYAGPHPVIAHPPCGPWSRLRHFCKHQNPACGPMAVMQVRRWGGVLEHPASSTLFRACGLPLPGEPADEFGGWSLACHQVAWGHRADKHTWLYLVGVDPSDVQVRTGGVATHCVTTARRGGPLLKMDRRESDRTPSSFAEFLVDIARRATIPLGP